MRGFVRRPTTMTSRRSKPPPAGARGDASASSSAGESGTRYRSVPFRLQGLEHPRNRAALSLDSWRYSSVSYWLQCAWDDAQKAGVAWDDPCLEVLGEKVDPPEPKCEWG